MNAAETNGVMHDPADGEDEDEEDNGLASTVVNLQQSARECSWANPENRRI